MHTDTIPDNWISSTLGDAIACVIGGGTPSRAVSSYWEGSIPWASVKDFQDDIQLLHDTIEHISLAGLARSAANEVVAGTVIVCTRMAVGRAAIVTRPTAINQDLKALYPKSLLQAKYLLFLIYQHRHLLEALSIGSTVKGITLDQLLSLNITIPPKSEQHCIAQILDTLDTQIQETNKLIAKLKQMKTGLLHDLLTHGIDENGEVRDPVAHPEQFKESQLGRIPREWEVTSINSLAIHVGSGLTPTGGKEVYKKEGVIFIRSQNVTFDGLLLDDVVFIDPKIHERMKHSEVFANDVLLNITGASIGRCCPLPEEISPANVNQHVCAIRLPNPNREDSIVLSSILSSPIGQSQIDRLNAGGNREGLNYEQIRSFVIPWPLRRERMSIARMIDAQNICLRSEESNLNKLKKIKKGLMHDLLTGQVRVTQLTANDKE